MAKKKNGQRISKRDKRRQEQVRAAKMRNIRLLGIAVFVIAVIFGVIAWRNAGTVSVEELDQTVSPNLFGPETAPVRIVEYGDFGCPSCRAWHNAGIKEQLLATYGDQIAFEFRHFPVITVQSPKAAEAGQCAAEQGAFWQYHDYIYEATPQGALSISELKNYAGALNLDKTEFDACLDSGKYRDYVARDARRARQDGARGTPSFFINGQPASFSYQGMAAMIEQYLAN